MAKQTADASTPNTENFTVKRRYLTEREIERLMDTARKVGRHGHRARGVRFGRPAALTPHQRQEPSSALAVARRKPM
jgi:hypothetical protein